MDKNQSASPNSDERPPSRLDKKAIVVFASFLAALVLLVALNMK